MTIQKIRIETFGKEKEMTQKRKRRQKCRIQKNGVTDQS